MNHKISTKELFGVVVSLSCSLFSMFGTSLIINSSKNSTLLAITIGFVLGFIPLSLIIYIFNHLGNKNIFEYNKDKLKVLGCIINVLICLPILYMGFIITWRTLQFTITNLLPENSYYFVGLVLFSIIGYSITKGKEVIGRSNIILTIILLFILGFICIFLIPNVKIDNFLPIFNISKNNFIISCLYFPVISVYPLISLLSIRPSDVVDKDNFKKCLIKGYSLTFIMIFIFYFLMISIYGSNFTSILSYPEYYLFKKINAFNFIQRVENICSITYYIVSYGGICYLIYFIKEAFSKTFNISKKWKQNIIIFLVADLTPIVSVYLFKKYHINFLINNYLKYTLPILVFIMLESILVVINKKINHKGID